MKNKKKVITSLISIVLLVILLSIALIKNIYATNQNHYAIDVIKENATSSDNNLILTENIIKPDGATFFSSQQLNYEVCLENISKAADVETQAAIVVDCSESMITNDSQDIIRATANDLATGIINNVHNSKVSISNNDAVKKGMTNDITEITSSINTLTLDNQEDSNNGLEKAYSTLSRSTNVEKYIIVFTDASDNVSAKMQDIVARDNNVKIISILVDAISTYYYLNNIAVCGDVYLLLSTVDKSNVTTDVEYYDAEKIYTKLNKTNKSIKVTNVFSEEVQKYFTVSNPTTDNGTVTLNSTGYEWTIDKLDPQDIAKLNFTLTLNVNIDIDEADLFKNICTNKTQDITYTTYDNASSELNGTDERDKTNATTIQIGKGYDLKIKAVSEANPGLAVEGIEFNVTGRNENGEIICSTTKTTDSDGYIIITEDEERAMRIAGTTTFSIIPNVTVPGYGPTSSVTFEIQNKMTGEISYNDNGLNLTHNVKLDTREVEVQIPIATKKFAITVNLAEQDNTNVKINNVEFRLIQPKINNKYELSALYGTTGTDGRVIFNPTTIAKAGTYEYILSQTSENPNYESMGNVTLRITFDDNGEVTNIDKKYNDKVTASLVNGTPVVNVYNVNKNASKFNFQIELSDETNNNDKLEDAIYNIEVITDDGNSILYENQVTDENGQINLQLQGTGYIQIKVTEVLPQVGYYQDQTVKEIIVRRVDGTIKFLVNNPAGLNSSYTDNSVKLNLTSKMNANQSLVKISVADSEENDILFPNVKVKLIGLLTNEEYDGVTDADGIATFKIQPQKPGIYPYQIVVDNTSLPNGYSDITEQIKFSIEFGETREITDTSNISNSVLCNKTEYADEDFVYKVANAKVLADINEEDQYNFKINLTDLDSRKPISGATYELSIDNGTTVKKIPSRITDKDGEISTRIIASENITIKVKQTKTKTGYKVDINEQTIELKKVNGIYQIINQWPYDYSDNANGAIIDGNNIIYKHTNERKGNDSVLLNVYINKKDKEDHLISGLSVRVYSDTLKNSSGKLLNEQLLTDQYGYIQIEKIKVTNVEIPQDCEHFLYIVETDGDGNDIQNSLVKLKLTFRYNDNKQIVELTNAESTWGNRLLNQNTKTFNGYETEIAYESNLYLDIYGSITDIGNFSIDFRKLNEDNQILEGGKYDVTIIRPDGTKLIQRDLEITDSVEFDGFFVSEGTKIEITEVEAPIGYQKNANTETLKIETIADDSSIVASFGSGSTSIISDVQYIQMSDGTIKTCIQVDLFDKSMNTLKFGIKTVDRTTNQGVAGFGYYVFTDRGIQVNTSLTNEDGQINNLIGASYPEKTVTYTIKEIETAEYYKKLKDPIILKIVFEEDGRVDTLSTLAAQTDANFGTTWDIIETNTEDGNDIDIIIKNEPQDPFTVEIQTVDKITGAEVTSFEYRITPSVNLDATGATNVLVGYVAPGTMKNYEIDKLADVANYTMYKQKFSLVFDADGNIAEDPSGLTEYLEFVSRTAKSVKFKVYVEPKVPIVIKSVGYFNSEPLENSEYTIIQDKDTRNTSTNSDGEGAVFNGVFKQDGYLTYTIIENQLKLGYVKLASFKIKVHFNSNKEIDDVQLDGVANRWIETGYKTPSESTDFGYNGNNKGIVQITLKHYPEFLINIKNQDRLDDTISLSGTKYTVEASTGVRDDKVMTDQDGIGVARLDRTLINDKITYTIKETRAASLYQTIEKNVIVDVYFDENGYAASAEVKDGKDFAEASTIENITDPRQNFEINVTIKNNKMLKFNITAENLVDSTQKVSGLKYEATSKLDTEHLSSSTMQTDPNGQGILAMDKDYANETIEYTIKENGKVSEYQSQGEELKIEVTFDSNGQIIEDSVRITSGTGYTTITRIDKESFDIDLTIKKCKMLKFNITAEDMNDNNQKVNGLKYEAISELNGKSLSSSTMQTDENGQGTLSMDKDYANETIRYTIKETSKVTEYQSQGEELKIEVTFDSIGQMIEDSVKVISGNGYTVITKTDKQSFDIDITIKKCKMLKFNITAVDSQDDTYVLRELTFTAQSSLDGENLSSDRMQTDENGKGTLKLDKDYANKTITYTIKETRKIAGYQFPGEDLVIEVAFDSKGIIIPDTVKMTSGSGYTTITNIDTQNFAIDLKITNNEIEQFGLNIVSVDKYDESIKIPDVHYEAYLTKGPSAVDEDYRGNTVTNQDGEGYIQYDKYVSSNPNGDETRALIIKESNLSTDYRPIRTSAILINVTFNPNGTIKAATVSGGYNSYIGWCADTRFISVTAYKYTINVTVRHYPYLFMNVKAEDIYTGEKLAGKYKISTTRGPGYSNVNVSKTFMQNKIAKVQEDIYQTENRGATLDDLVIALLKDTSIDRIQYSEDGRSAQFIVDRTTYTVNSLLEVTSAQAPGYFYGTTGITNIDYFGYGYGEVLTQNYQTTNDGNWTKAGIGPTERETQRTYYIYEEQAPSTPMQYQQYRPRYLSWEYSKIIATVTVNYNDKGRIIDYKINSTISNNNIKEFLEVEILDGTNLGITIKYAPITTMEVTAIDNVSKTGLSNIRIWAYQNNEYATNRPYEYRTTTYYATDANGKTNYTYWGANIDNGQNEYYIDTSLMGYKGYFEAGRIKIHVAYDEYGRISAADVLSTDGNGMPNAEIVSFENNKLKINILYNRKFYLKIDKQDEYDSNTKLSAEFNIKSDKGANTTIRPNYLTMVGMVRPGEIVKYTLSETTTPQNYFTLDNVEFYVAFNSDGTVGKVTSNSKMFSELNKRAIVDKVRQTEVEDLLIGIKNEPQFILKLTAIDKWINSKTLENVSFEIRNNQGDVATGNPVTANNGALSVIVGKAYQNKTVKYEIRQTSTPSGYNVNNKTIKIEVDFNDQGRIKNYSVSDGESTIRIDPNKFKDQRYIQFNVLNTPKDIFIGINNYDKITKQGISEATYEIIAEEKSSGNIIKQKDFTTNSNGIIIDTINEFKETPGNERIVKYTVKQKTKPDSYRKIQDIVFEVVFNEDGSIRYRTPISNPSNATIELNKYLSNTPVNMLISIPNENAYDLIIKNEDKNYKDLGIKGTIYDITINGETFQRTTDISGLVNILSRQDVGNITIRISENQVGVGYQHDINNETTLEIEKGATDYSLKLISNSNPNYANVVINEEYGTIEVTFQNETKSSIKLVKDNKDVGYKITQNEMDSSGNLTYIKDIGTDISDEEELYYELGATPQNKIIVYKFEQISAPSDYNYIGIFNVKVEYDMYGNIKNNITTDSDRVYAIESGDKTHDVVVIVDEYIPPSIDNPDNPDNPDNTDNTGGNGQYGDIYQGSLTINKDNKDVRYEISLVEVDSNGNHSDEKPIGSDLQESAKEQLYYGLGELAKSATIIIRVKEVGTIPNGYNSKGTIEITAKTDDKGLIYDIDDNCEDATTKLTPEGTNNIALVIGKEYGSITFYKDHNQARYEISSKNKDGSDEKTIKTEEEGTNQKIVYISIREPLAGKNLVYKFSPKSVPVGFESKGDFEIEVQYSSIGNIAQIQNYNTFVTTEIKPEVSSNLIVSTITEETNPDSPNNPDNTEGENGQYGDIYQGRIIINKDNKDVRYDVSLVEIDSNANTSIVKTIGNDLKDVIAKEQLYYNLGILPKSKTIIIRVKEVGEMPDGYVPKGIIEITAKTNDKGLIYFIDDNCEQATTKLIPEGTNNISLVIGKEYGSITFYKDNNKARYEISSKNKDGLNEKIIKTEEEGTTEKIVYISIREPLADKDIIYKFTPISVPDEFVSKGAFELDVQYDSEGKIGIITNNNYFVTAGANPEGSSDLVVVSMTDEKLEYARNPYSIKIVSQEVDTNLRINNSIFDITVREGEGDENLIAKEEGLVTTNVSKKGYIIEKGVIKIENIKNSGNIYVDIDQQQPTAEGYKFGNQKITGTVSLDVQYQNMKDATINVKDKDGFDVSIDPVNKVVTIKVNNEPEATMEIQNILKTKDEEGNTIEENVEGSKFVITSQIQTKQDITDTDLNVTTAKTDEEGNTSAKAGTPYLGKNVLYTIHQLENEENKEYEEIEDIILLVTYDTKGQILYQEVMSNPDDAKVIGEIGTRNIKLQVINTIKNQKHGYKLVIEKHHIDNGEYEELIPGAKYKIEVEQEYGEFYTKWEAITDSEGKITSSLFDGYGNINIKITETEAPEGFEISKEPVEIKFKRDKKTGICSTITSERNFDINNIDNYTEILVRTVDEPKDDLYTIMINKQDKRTHKQIIESSAKFDVTMITEENVGTEEDPIMEETEKYLGSFSTSNIGKAKIENLIKPSMPGTYKYIITEIESPNEYLKLTEDVVLQIDFIEDSKGKIVMGDNPQILSGDGSIRSKKGDLLNIIINNENENDFNKYTLDITKVDAETKEPIEAQALYKVWLPDNQNTALYTETSVNDYGIGKLDYCYIEQDKDYQTRLTRMQLPNEEGTIKYVFREIIAPEGYKKIDEDLELNIEFKKYEDKDGMYINSITSNLPKYVNIKTETPCTTDTVLKIDILNDKKIDKEFKISYNANDDGEGTKVPNEQIKEFDKDIQLDELVPEREGYIFKGWARKKDAIDIEFNPGDIYTNNENLTLYAIWEKKLYLKSTEYYIGTGNNRAGEIDYWTPGSASAYKEGDLYIQGIRPQAGQRIYPTQNVPNYGTYLEEFLDNLETNADERTVYIPTEVDADGNRVLDNNSIVNNNETLIKTGMVVKLTKGEQEITLTIIVRGDLTDKNGIIGDGMCGMWESNQVKTLNRNNLTTNYSIIDQLAIDFYINKDNNYQINKNALRKAYQEHSLANLNIK